jgi:hypothetical protein
MDTLLGDEFAFEGVNFFDDVVELFEERAVVELGAHPCKRLARQPAPFIVGVEDFEIVTFDFDDQPQLFRELELVTMVFGSAVNEIADVKWAGLQPYQAVCTAQTNPGIDSRSICALGPHVAQFGSRFSLYCRNDMSKASYRSKRPDNVVPILRRILIASVA